jgi:hypothetical protein
MLYHPRRQWALGAPRRAQSVERVETDRVAVRAEIFDKRSARQVLGIIWLVHGTSPSQQIVETCGKVRLICIKVKAARQLMGKRECTNGSGLPIKWERPTCRKFCYSH